jgi:hypothetical protein
MIVSGSWESGNQVEVEGMGIFLYSEPEKRFYNGKRPPAFSKGWKGGTVFNTMDCLKHTQWDCKDHIVRSLKMFGGYFGKDPAGSQSWIKFSKGSLQGAEGFAGIRIVVMAGVYF